MIQFILEKKTSNMLQFRQGSKNQKDRGKTYSMIDELMIGFLVKTVPEEIETPTSIHKS